MSNNTPVDGIRVPKGLRPAVRTTRQAIRVRPWEMINVTGRQSLATCMALYKEKMCNLNEYYLAQLKWLGVQIESEREATLELIKNAEAGMLIIATGISTRIPVIYGMNQIHFFLAQEVLEGKTEVNYRAVIIGGDTVGFEIAAF